MLHINCLPCLVLGLPCSLGNAMVFAPCHGRRSSECASFITLIEYTNDGGSKGALTAG
jgi:hypothetical protein